MTGEATSSTRRLRGTVSVVALVFSVGVLFTHVAGRLYPVLPASLFLAVLTLLVGITSESNDRLSHVYLAVVALTGVLYTVYILLFPSSVVGIDPNVLVVDIQEIIADGTISGIKSTFYSTVPLYYLLPAVFGKVSNLSALSAIVVFPIVLSVAIPYSAAIVANNLVDGSRPFIGVLAALITVSATLTFKFSYWPIPQSLATVLVCLFVVLLVRNYNSVHRETLLLEVFFLVAMLFTHKLPLLFTLGVIFGVLATTPLQSRVSNVVNRSSTSLRRVSGALLGLGMFSGWYYVTDFFTTVVFQGIGVGVFLLSAAVMKGKQSGSPSIPSLSALSPSFLHLIGTAAVTTFLILIQFFVITDFAERVLERLLTFQGTDLQVTASLAETSSLATSPDLPLFGVFFHYSNILVLLLVSGIAWIYVVLFFKQNSAAHVLLVATVAGVFFTISTVFNPEAASPFRFLLFGEPWFATLVAVSFGGFLFQDKFSSRALVILLLALILGFQVFSFAIVPDYTASPRYYITESESHAKMFGYDQARGSIGTDPFFVTASAPQEVRSQRYQESEKYEPVEQEFVAGNITDQGYEYFAYRDVQVYRLSSGWWELLWDPQAPLDSSNARFYDSGSVQFYTNTTMTETFAPTRRGPTTSRG